MKNRFCFNVSDALVYQSVNQPINGDRSQTPSLMISGGFAITDGISQFDPSLQHVATNGCTKHVSITLTMYQLFNSGEASA